MYCSLFQDAAVRCVTKYGHLHGTLKAVRMWPEGVTSIALALELPYTKYQISIVKYCFIFCLGECRKSDELFLRWASRKTRQKGGCMLWIMHSIQATHSLTPVTLYFHLRCERSFVWVAVGESYAGNWELAWFGQNCWVAEVGCVVRSDDTGCYGTYVVVVVVVVVVVTVKLCVIVNGVVIHKDPVRTAQ